MTLSSRNIPSLFLGLTELKVAYYCEVEETLVRTFNRSQPDVYVAHNWECLMSTPLGCAGAEVEAVYAHHVKPGAARKTRQPTKRSIVIQAPISPASKKKGRHDRYCGTGACSTSCLSYPVPVILSIGRHIYKGAATS